MKYSIKKVKAGYVWIVTRPGRRDEESYFAYLAFEEAEAAALEYISRQ